MPPLLCVASLCPPQPQRCKPCFFHVSSFFHWLDVGRSKLHSQFSLMFPTSSWLDLGRSTLHSQFRSDNRVFHCYLILFPLFTLQRVPICRVYVLAFGFRTMLLFSVQISQQISVHFKFAFFLLSPRTLRSFSPMATG